MGLEKVGTTLGKEFIAWTRTSGKSLLATRPVKVNTAGLKLAPKLEGDVVHLNRNGCFDSDWKAVTDAYKKATGKPIKYFGTVKDSKHLSDQEKAIALYCDDDYSTAVNLFERYGKDNEWYEWYAQKYGLTDKIISKYKNALKYAFNNTSAITTYQGSTFRWQKAGTFSDRFSNVKIGDIIQEPSFLSSSQTIRNCDSFRCNLNRERSVPELLIVKGKNGKIIPEKLAGFRSYEKEVLYNADTKYKYLGEKQINSPVEIGLSEHIQFLKEAKEPFVNFQPCKVIYPEEI